MDVILVGLGKACRFFKFLQTFSSFNCYRIKLTIKNCIMKLVNLYHLVGVGILLLMTLSFSLGFKESAVILGIGLIAVLVLGVHLVLDKMDDSFYYHEKKLVELSDNIDTIKASVEIIGNLSNHGIVSSSFSLEQIKQDIDKIEKDIEDLNNKIKS